MFGQRLNRASGRSGRSTPVSKEGIHGWIGVDPGRSSGCISIWMPSVNAVECYPLSKLTDREIWNVVSDLAEYGPVFAVLEAVHAMPKQGISSTFKFGTSFGELKMALVAAEIPFELVSPQKWQKALSCQTKGQKNVSKNKAQQLWPDIKITHATADSLLLAEYGRRFLERL